MPVPAFVVSLAQALDPAPKSPDPQLLDVDGTFFIMLGIFLLTMFVLTKFLWRPYLRVRGERVARVEGYREEAKRLESEAAARLQKVEAELGEARRAGSAERARARAAAQAKEREIVAAAQAAAQKTLAEASARLEATLAAERKTLETRAGALGREAAERILGRKVA